jgi:hypothetical protein
LGFLPCATHHQARHDDPGRSDDDRVLLHVLLRHIETPSRVEGERVLVLHQQVAPLSTSQHRFAARIRDVVPPVLVIVHPAAHEPHLGLVPGVGHGSVVAVVFEGAEHAVAHRRVHFLPENVAEDSPDQHGHENEKEGDEVRHQHAAHFFDGAETAETRDEGDQEAGDDEDVSGAGVEVGPEEFVGEGFVDDGPEAQTGDDQAAQLDKFGTIGEFNKGHRVRTRMTTFTTKRLYFMKLPQPSIRRPKAMLMLL